MKNLIILFLFVLPVSAFSEEVSRIGNTNVFKVVEHIVVVKKQTMKDMRVELAMKNQEILDLKKQLVEKQAELKEIKDRIASALGK